MKIGDILKSERYDWLDGAKIFDIKDGCVYFKLRGFGTENINMDIINSHIKEGNIKIISDRIENWKKRIR